MSKETYSILIGIGIEIIFLILGITIKDIPTWAVLIAYIIGGLFILYGLIGLFYPSCRIPFTQGTSEKSNWIADYIKKHKKLPLVPAFMNELVENYINGMVVSKELKLINPSAQLWYTKLLPSQREQILELVEWLGQDRLDYLEIAKRHWPPSKPVSGFKLLQRK
jgi:hypothetical protein